MTEQLTPSGDVDNQNKTNRQAEEKARWELNTAVTASKKFLEDNYAELYDLAKAEDQARFPSEASEKTRTTYDFEDSHEYIKNVYRSYDHEKYKNLVPYPDIQLTFSQKATAFKELLAQAKQRYESYFGPTNGEDSGEESMDYMSRDERDRAGEKWRTELEAAKPAFDAAKEAVALYYHEHQNEIAANREVMERIGLKEYKEREALRPRGNYIDYSDNDEEQ